MFRITKLKREFDPSNYGYKAVIVCNGPSLAKVDFESLSGVFTIGLNKINLAFQSTDWRPSIICCVNKYVLDQNADFFQQSTIPCLLANKKESKKITSKNVYKIRSLFYPRFCKNIVFGVNEGWTVTYVAMQVAYWLGFKDVVLIGCDHNFLVKKGLKPNELDVMDVDKNHFIHGYFQTGTLWQAPDLDRSEESYMKALDVFSKDDRRLRNATVGGHLDLLERVKLEDWLREDE